MDARERRKWLLSIPEDESFSLPIVDWYDRIRFIREDIGRAAVNGHSVSVQHHEQEKVPPRACNSPARVYKHWVHD